VIAAAAAVNDPVGEAGAGFSVAPEAGALEDALLRMVATHPAKRAAMGRAARRFMLENHDYRVLAGRFAELLDRTLAAG
jgi:glycosyltransferase involved in cell wall biosynthesis